MRTIISPGRYVQGKGALHQVGHYLGQLGSAPLFVSDELVWGFVGHDIEASLRKSNLPCKHERFAGVPSAREVDRLAEVVKRTGADVVVAVGGGGTIDAVKAAGFLAGVRWANCPTVASTDAPCSALSVIYAENGEFEEYRFFPRNPELVLVDSQVVANAPASFLVAGVGDALATWIEARATARSDSPTMAGGSPTVTGTALAKLSWEILWENAIPAVDAVAVDQVTPAVEKVIEANTLLSGLGFESGGLAAAHAIHNGLTAVSATHGLAHGQKVNVGSVAQLVLEGAQSSEVRDFIEFTTRLGLPTTLTEVGLAPDDVETLRTISEVATAEGETIHSMPFDVSSGDVVSALASIDRFSARVRESAKLPDPLPYASGVRHVSK